MSLSQDATTSTATVPPVRPAARDDVRSRRMWGLFVGLATTGLLAFAAWLSPSESGMGTHTQIGMPPCGWVMLFDMPCPTCGMTTAFAHATDGNLLASMRAQPLGALLALMTGVAAVVSWFVFATGSNAALMFRGLWNRRMIIALAVFAAASWGYKIASYRGVM